MTKTSLKKKILLGMAAFLDEAVDWHQAITSPYLILKSDHYKKQTIYNTISGFLKTGYLEKKINKRGEVVYRITSQGQTKIRYEIPLARYTNKRWDGVWKLVSFDIPEKTRIQRDRLRDKMKELGFGMLQESLWITPHDLGQQFEQFLEQQNLKGYCVVWEAKTIFGKSEREMVYKVWKLDDLHSQHLDLIKKFNDLLKNQKSAKQKKKEWLEEYFTVLVADPGLPKELLPDDWLLEKVKKLFFSHDRGKI